MNILISLIRGYGLGDAVQMSAVLRHIRKHRPDWVVDFQAEVGRETIGYGIVRNVFVYGEQYPSSHYDAEVQIVLYDTFANWHDRPNTRVTSCLHERFSIEWDRECGSYEINIPESIVVKLPHKRYVAVHYQGDTAKHNKDLTDEQMLAICELITDAGYMPLHLDWRKASTLGVESVRRLGLSGGYSAAMNCAVIASCVAFIGIDSGPSKCASATKTPTLVIWTGHHPSPFHDPAPNTTHLVPVGYHGLEPVCNDPGVIKFFEANYNVRKYENLVEAVGLWLKEIL